MKYILLLILFCLSLYPASGQQYTAVEFEKRDESTAKNIVLCTARQQYSSPESFNIRCSNVFEWQIFFASGGKTFAVSVNGLANVESEEFLYDSEHLFYKPEQKNNVLDFASTGKWELRFSLVLDLYFKK